LVLLVNDLVDLRGGEGVGRLKGGVLLLPLEFDLGEDMELPILLVTAKASLDLVLRVGLPFMVFLNQNAIEIFRSV
jgi:hypothetical protein